MSVPQDTEPLVRAERAPTAPVLDVDSLRRWIDEGRTFRFRFFWGHRAHKDGILTESCFSQWWPCRFVVDGRVYSSAEQFMMSAKAILFGDEDALRAIMASDDPAEAKALGRRVRNFDEERWEAARFDLVTHGNVAKFGQDERLREYLLSTGDAILVEASPRDCVWGIGLGRDNPRARDPRTWRGLNLLGFALVRARGILAGSLPAPFGESR